MRLLWTMRATMSHTCPKYAKLTGKGIYTQFSRHSDFSEMLRLILGSHTFQNCNKSGEEALQHERGHPLDPGRRQHCQQAGDGE